MAAGLGCRRRLRDGDASGITTASADSDRLRQLDRLARLRRVRRGLRSCGTASDRPESGFGSGLGASPGTGFGTSGSGNFGSRRQRNVRRHTGSGQRQLRYGGS